MNLLTGQTTFERHSMGGGQKKKQEQTNSDNEDTRSNDSEKGP